MFASCLNFTWRSWSHKLCLFFTKFSPGFWMFTEFLDFTRFSPGFWMFNEFLNFTRFSPGLHQVFTRFLDIRWVSEFHQVFTRFSGCSLSFWISPGFHHVSGFSLSCQFSPSFHQVYQFHHFASNFTVKTVKFHQKKWNTASFGEISMCKTLLHTISPGFHQDFQISPSSHQVSKFHQVFTKFPNFTRFSPSF